MSAPICSRVRCLVGGCELAVEQVLGRARLSAGRQEAWQHSGHDRKGKHPQEHSAGNLQHIAHVHRFFPPGLGPLVTLLPGQFRSEFESIGWMNVLCDC